MLVSCFLSFEKLLKKHFPVTMSYTRSLTKKNKKKLRAGRARDYSRIVELIISAHN